jgi:hypothetical protein
MVRHCFDTDQDPNLTFCFDAGSDTDPGADRTLKLD